MEFDEYVELPQDITKNTKGSIIEGSLKIDLVVKYEINNNNMDFGFNQPIMESSHIIVGGIVTQIEDECTIRCNIIGLSIDIVIEFEDDIVVYVEERIQLEGSLELEVK